ncbi:DNA cytosine methyltransferase [Desulfobacterales bacterium HSG16]|nr:DNA cytosine methyltransferase [Desulfobacterales bacterium HSG16]
MQNSLEIRNSYDNFIFIPNTLVLGLTTIERSYLQTFPDSFKFEGTKTNLEQMIGNAVPVNLAEFVAKGILEYCENGEMKEIKQQSLFPTTEQFIMPNKALS